MKKTSEWFKNWFDSDYYHVLYKHRNHQEAKTFIARLIDYLNPPQEATFLDKACGRGRHVNYIAKHGFDATGLDLSPNNIAFAKQKWGAFAHFQIHDMRQVYQAQGFDYVLSLFTSFGYFDSLEENELVLKAAYDDLKPNGTLVLDFLNVAWVKAHLKENDVKHIKGIEFKLKRQLTNGIIVKNIDLVDGENQFHFEEKVKAISMEELKNLCHSVGFANTSIFGSYSLETFEPTTSERVIIIAKKA